MSMSALNAWWAAKEDVHAQQFIGWRSRGWAAQQQAKASGTAASGARQLPIGLLAGGQAAQRRTVGQEASGTRHTSCMPVQVNCTASPTCKVSKMWERRRGLASSCPHLRCRCAEGCASAGTAPPSQGRCLPHSP